MSVWIWSKLLEQIKHKFEGRLCFVG